MAYVSTAQMMKYSFSAQEEACLLEELGSLGWVTHAQGQSAAENAEYLRRESGVFRLIYMVRGEQEWTLAKQGIVRHAAGAMLVLPPSQPYDAIDGRMSANEFFWLDLRMTASGALPGVSQSLGREFYNLLREIADRPVPLRAAARDAFEKIVAAHSRRKTFSEVAARAALHDLLLLAVEARSPSNAAQVRQSPHVTEARRWMEMNLAENPSVAELAAHIGLSAVHLRKKFSEEVGVSPSRYLAELRLQQAKRLLQEKGKSIAVIASTVGLSSGQNFATFFRKYTGFTPAQYRKRIAELGDVANA
ncbi:MAG: AraC family transcriptional regulator [Planctomycetaceae bacterium]|nr:AraC family transcriptional regulator [Planctomycetaceae bacterium]